MKQYLWIGIVVLLVSAHASDNPFDLKENFGKLDKEQEVLLSELKRLAELKEAAEEEAVVQEATVDEKKEVVIASPVIKESENKITESLDTVIEEVSDASSSQLNTMRQNTLAESEESFNAKISNSENIKVTELGKEAQEKEALLVAVKQKEAELQQLRAEELRQIEAKKDAERREVEAYEKQRAEKLARQKVEEAKQIRQQEKLPEELQKMKDIIEVKVEGNTEALDGDVKNIFERLLKEKDNPDFSLADAQKIIDGNKKAGMAIVVYMMGKSLAQYNQLTPSEKKEFDQKAMESIEKDMENGSSGNTQKEKMDEYAKKYPNEVRALGFAFLEDILANGIPQVDFNMQMSVEASSGAGESGTLTVKTDSNIKTKEKQKNIVDINVTREKIEEKIAADKAYEDAVREMKEES